MAAQDRIEISRFAHPHILLARIAGHISKSVLAKKIINETGAIHSAVCGISGAVCVTEILRCQIETGLDDLAHFSRVSIITGNFVR